MKNSSRAIRQVKASIAKLQLDLSDQVVLTELGSNNYLLLPLIALLANADEVIAWTRDCKYFKAEKVVKDFEDMLVQLDYKGKIQIRVNERPIEDIRRADIVTNSGMLRPLNADFLKSLKNNAVIPLMFEAWELRQQDIDIAYCKNNGIKVAGTWENHPHIGVFHAVGHLAIKLALEAGYEVYQNSIYVWSDDHFGEETKAAFETFGAKQVFMGNDVQELISLASQLDFVYLCDYEEKRPFFGPGGILDLNEVTNQNPSIGFIHLIGNVDVDYAAKLNVLVYPFKNGKAEIMSETLAYLGSNVVVNLQAAGLKVAQCMLHNLKSSLVQPITYKI